MKLILIYYQHFIFQSGTTTTLHIWRKSQDFCPFGESLHKTLSYYDNVLNFYKPASNNRKTEHQTKLLERLFGEEQHHILLNFSVKMFPILFLISLNSTTAFRGHSHSGPSSTKWQKSTHRRTIVVFCR
jgi:hypothetical protein